MFTKGLNLGVDFVGGQMVRVTFVEQHDAPVAELREEIDALGYGEPIIQQFGEPNEISVRMRLPEGRSRPGAGRPDGAARSSRRVEADYPDARDRRRRRGLGQGLRASCSADGMIALALAMLGISIYIWVRFEWQFGVGALFALVHDVTLTLGLFALTGMEFDLNIVAALLTLIGYSLNDTIVVYDRIRENLKKYRKMPLPELLDLSVNETLSRTVVTSTSLLITLVALLLLGPGRDLRLHRGDHARHLRRHLQLDLHGGADPDLARRDVGQLRADREPRRRAGPQGARRGLGLPSAASGSGHSPAAPRSTPPAPPRWLPS